MIYKQSELVTVFYEDGQKVGMLYQNGTIELYRLVKATKQDTAQLLEIDIPQDETYTKNK